jgi:MFS family permease
MGTIGHLDPGVAVLSGTDHSTSVPMTATSPPDERVSIYPILSITFVGTLGFGIVLPFLVYLVTRLGGNALIYGIMGATYSVFQLIGAPILGRWSDRFGRKRILLVSQLGTLASWAIFLGALALPVTPMFSVDSPLLGAFTITVPLAVLFFARALDGITGGNVSVANALLADITPENERAANFGKMAVSSNLGFIAGPALAGVLGATALGEVPPVVAALLISAIASFMVAFMLYEPTRCVLTADPESTQSVRQLLGPGKKACFTIASKQMATSEILRLPSIPRLLTLHFLVFLAFNFFYIAFPVYAVSVLEWTLFETGVFFSVLSLMMVGVQGPVLSRVSKALSDRTLVVAGSAVLATSFVCFTSTNTVTLYVGAALVALGNGLMWPSLLAIISKASDSSVQGAVQGFAGSSGAIASIAGLLAGGLLFDTIQGGVFVLAAVVAGVVVLGALGIERRSA